VCSLPLSSAAHRPTLVTVAYPRPADSRGVATVPFECEIDPKFACMDELLADPRIELALTNDLARSAPEAWWNRRPAIPVEVTLRVAVARRLTPAPNRRCGVNWSLREAESEIGGSALALVVSAVRSTDARPLHLASPRSADPAPGGGRCPTQYIAASEY